MERQGNRISIFTILIILVIIVVAILCLKFFVLDKNNKLPDNSENYYEDKEDNTVVDIYGGDYVKSEEGVRINTSETLQNEKELDGFTFNNFYVYSVEGLTRIEFDVTNNLEFREVLGKYKMILYSDKEKIGEILCEGEEFAANETKRLNVTVGADVSNLYNVKLEKVYTQSI